MQVSFRSTFALGAGESHSSFKTHLDDLEEELLHLDLNRFSN